MDMTAAAGSARAGATILTALLKVQAPTADAARPETGPGLRAELARLWPYAGLPVANMAARLGTTAAALHGLARRMGLPRRPSPGVVAAAAAWTPEREALAVDLWRNGRSAARCLAALNALPGPPLTRSAVGFRAAKCAWRRAGMAQRGRLAAAKARVSAPWEPPEPAIMRLLAAPDPTMSLCRTREPLAPCSEALCRWPFGDPRAAGFCFCAEPRVPHGSYCAMHAERAHSAVRSDPAQPGSSEAA